MSDVELPSGWALTTLSDLGVEAQPGFASGRHNRDGEGVLHLRPMNVSREGTLDLRDTRHVLDDSDRRIRSGDVLFNNTNSPALVGKTTVVNVREPVAYSNHMTRLRPPDGVSAEFLAQQLHWLWSSGYFLSVLNNHVNQASVATKRLLETPIVVPPTAEQHRIVEALEGHLSRLDVGTRSLVSLRTRTTRLRAVLYGKAVQGEFSKPMRADENVPLEVVEDASRSLSKRKWTPPEAVGIPGYVPPDHWTVTSLGSLSHSSDYGTSTKCDYNAAGQAVLRIPNVQEGSIDLSDIKHSIDSTLDLSKYFLEPGDLLFVRTNGSRNLIGRVGVVEESLSVAFASYLIRFRLTPDFVEPRWVQLVTQSPLWRHIIEGYAASSAGQYNLSAETLARLPIPVPSLEAQRQALETVDYFLASATRLSSAINASELRASRLRSSILRTAFTGQLVPQDPADEPASVLLDRIRAKRAAAPKPQRTRRPRTAPAAATPAPTPTPAPRIAIQQEFQL
ncbi:restriction endonuclease subunit S [Streptomyces niveus]|uniref:restriction endonuclease subunit S n=1 Tax=Streptomyces niveus TaxID=193462 RepID=UPI0036BEB8F0